MVDERRLVAFTTAFAVVFSWSFGAAVGVVREERTASSRRLVHVDRHYCFIRLRWKRWCCGPADRTTWIRLGVSAIPGSLHRDGIWFNFSAGAENVYPCGAPKDFGA